MQRMTVGLTSEDRRLLDAESARTGRSIAALIRDAIAKTYGSQPGLSEHLPTVDTELKIRGAEEVDRESADRRGSRLAAIRETAGILDGVYRPDEASQLRREWPD